MPYQKPQQQSTGLPHDPLAIQTKTSMEQKPIESNDTFSLLSQTIDSTTLRSFILSETEQDRYALTHSNLKKLEELNKKLNVIRWPFKRRKVHKLLHSVFSLPNEKGPVVADYKVDIILSEYEKLKTQTSARLSSRLETSVDKTTNKRRFKIPSKPRFLKRTKQKEQITFAAEPLKEKFERQIQLYRKQVNQAFERRQTRIGTLTPNEILESATATLEGISNLFHKNDIEAQEKVCKPLEQQHAVLIQRWGDLSSWDNTIDASTEFVKKNSGHDGRYISPVLNTKENEIQRLEKLAMRATERHWRK